VVESLGQVTAAVMVAADEELPEPRFKGAAQVLAARPAAFAAPWEGDGPGGAAAHVATAAEACAAFEMATRLTAALPEVIAALPPELRDASPEGAAGRLAAELWGALLPCCHSAARLAPDAGGGRFAAAAAAADALASLAKLAGAVARHWPCPGAPRKPRDALLLSLLAEAQLLLGRCCDALPAGARARADLVLAGTVAGVAGMRAALWLPCMPGEGEAEVMRQRPRLQAPPPLRRGPQAAVHQLRRARPLSARRAGAQRPYPAARSP
jgi:hypothetical protein